MADGDDADLDPRFDPRFQRGYAPPAPEEPDGPDGGSTGGAGQREGIDRRFDPRFQRGYDPELHRLPQREPDAGGAVFSSTFKGATAAAAPPMAPSEPAPTDTAGTDTDTAVDADPDPDEAAAVAKRSRVNPYVIWLWLVSVALVGGGVYYILQAAQNPTARFVASVAVGDIFDRVAWTVAPLALEIGLAAMVVLVIWHALSFARRRREH